MKIRKVDSKSVILHEGSNVILKTCGNSREVQFTVGNNLRRPIQNLSKDKYLDKETGEIKERIHQESRYQSPKSARKSIKRRMDLIRCNATEASHSKWITVTYSEVMTDHKRVYEDGKMFLRRLQRYFDRVDMFYQGKLVWGRGEISGEEDDGTPEEPDQPEEPEEPEEPEKPEEPEEPDEPGGEEPGGDPPVPNPPGGGGGYYEEDILPEGGVSI